MLAGTAHAWVEAITDGRTWDQQRDEDRVRKAFVTLSKTVRRWPAPVEFIEALPRPDTQALSKQPIPADPAKAAAAIAEVTQMLNPRHGKVAAGGPDA